MIQSIYVVSIEKCKANKPHLTLLRGIGFPNMNIVDHEHFCLSTNELQF